MQKSNEIDKKNITKLSSLQCTVGGPPGTPGAPPGAPKCPRGLEKNAKIPKNYIKNLHASKYPKL